MSTVVAERVVTTSAIRPDRGAEVGRPLTPSGASVSGCVPGGADVGGAWLTASIRPVGQICRCDADRLAVMLDALAGASSVVVLDLQAARIESARVARVVARAAALLDARDGCLVCVGADASTRACLERADALVAFVDPLEAPAPSVADSRHGRGGGRGPAAAGWHGDALVVRAPHPEEAP